MGVIVQGKISRLLATDTRGQVLRGGGCAVREDGAWQPRTMARIFMFGAVIACCVAGLGACAGTKDGNEGGKSQSPVEGKERAATPPVQFLYRRDRERLREQQELAGRMGTGSDVEAGASERPRAGGAGAGGGDGKMSPEIAALFDLSGATRASEDGDAGTKPRLSGAIVLSGDRAVVGATFDGATAATLMQFDLSTVRDRVSDDIKYTLQVARYGHTDRSQPTPQELVGFREAAEKAVLELRQAGEEAFFFHGPFGSTVTIGLFSEADYVTQVRDANGTITNLPKPYESAALAALRAKYPHNLVNGATLQTRRKGSEEMVTQGSFLVGVPR
jgi:hypothetical protein